MLYDKITNSKQLAWNKFRRSKEFATLYNALLQAGIKDPYAENIITRVWEAGWGDRRIIFFGDLAYLNHDGKPKHKRKP